MPRKLVAILHADVAGYSRLTGEDEDATHRALRDCLDLFASTIESYHGHVVNYAVLARFDSVSDSVACAMAIQAALRSRNDAVREGPQVRFRIGVEALAEPGVVCISDAVRTSIGNRLSFDYLFIGEQTVKSITHAVRAYRVFDTGSDRLEGVGYPGVGAVSNLAPPGKPSLVIKPFANISADPDQDYFAEGLTRDINIALVKIPGLFLAMDESPTAGQSKRMTVQQLGRRLDAHRRGAAARIKSASRC